MSSLLPVFGGKQGRGAGRELEARAASGAPQTPVWFDLDAPPPLADVQGRRYEYLRLSVTDRCDLACRYCMPPGGEGDHALRPELMSFEENARLVAIFARLGVRRVRFTGGEPLIRKHFTSLVQAIHDASEATELVLTSNATRLAPVARELRAAGLSGVNVSLDSLDPQRFREITRGGDLGAVLAGIEASLDAGLEVKINTVAMGGINDDEFGAIVDWAWARGITPRFIELMPLGEGAKMTEAFMGVPDIVHRLGERVADDAMGPVVTGRGPARYFASAADSSRRVGVIAAVSANFCDTCNRVRVTGRGDLRVCLASQRAISVRDAFRAGASDRDVAWATCWALGGKAQGHQFATDGGAHEGVGMSLVGG
ncbi:MAG: GTP 3',8-cyclase MoaA [Deltaproteobacteria bacterium]|nr:MAG: GTP 3',8-cyclase MoaA [Deltaproteobacteria bacterium]